MSTHLDTRYGRLLSKMRLPRSGGAELARALSSAPVVDVAEGDIVLREGDPGDALVVVLEGRVDVIVRDHNQALVPVAQLQGPLLLGVTGAVDGGARMATCVMSRPGKVARMPRGVFLQRIRENDHGAELLRDLMLATMHRQLQQGSARLREVMRT